MVKVCHPMLKIMQIKHACSKELDRKKEYPLIELGLRSTTSSSSFFFVTIRSTTSNNKNLVDLLQKNKTKLIT